MRVANQEMFLEGREDVGDEDVDWEGAETRQKNTQ